MNPDRSSASVASLQHINSGAFTLCFGAYVDISGTLQIDDLALTICEGTAACTDAPMDFSGTWTSSYECMDSCTGQSGVQSNTLWVVQDGASASYDDAEGGSYSGTVCGDTFTFTGGGPSWSESGRMRIKAAGSAVKESDYAVECCTGFCEDTLSRE
jgi:hypothetical protein